MANPIARAVAQGKLRLQRARSRWGLVDIVVRVLKRFSETDGGTHSKALTYYVFFSVFPLLAFAAAILGYVTFGDKELQDRLFAAAVKSFPMLKDALTPRGFAVIESRRQELAFLSLLFALYSGSGAVIALEHALNKVHRIDNEPNFVDKRIRGLKWLAILGMGAVLSVALSTLGYLTNSVFNSFGPIGAFTSTALLQIGGLALSVGILATAYRFLPAAELSWRDVLPGAIAGGIVFEILKFLSNLFVKGGVESRNATFGAFATAATLLIVSYLVSQMTLMAAEINAVLAERRVARSPATSN